MADHEADEEFEALLRFLRDDRGVDFTGYKRPSLTRLVNRRMRAAGVEDYRSFVDLLQVEPGELKSLLGKHPGLTPFQAKTVLYLISTNVGG